MTAPRVFRDDLLRGRTAGVIVLACGLSMVPTPGVGSTAAVSRAEALAAEALQLSSEDAEAGLVKAREALSLTGDFDPTDFVGVGRRGELVEDAYQQARREYRIHRARLYAAVGVALSHLDRHTAAGRYLRRAHELDPTPGRSTTLSRALLALGRGSEALDMALSGDLDQLDAGALEAAEAATDALGLASLQAEIDRRRLARLDVDPRVDHRDGPFRLTSGARLSTGGPFQLDPRTPTALYLSEPSCRSCSRDLEALHRVARDSLRVVMAPVDPDSDHALRQALRLYRYDWPFLVKVSTASALGAEAPSVLIVARGGWSNALVQPPFHVNLPPAIEILQRDDLTEPRPRVSWRRRPVERTRAPDPPSLLEEGLAPGEDDPAPGAFLAAVEAYRAGRYREALGLFESLEAEGDGWLLPPEARLNRARCLAGLRRHDEARRLLLRTGDSRFQEAVDRALESIGSSPR